MVAAALQEMFSLPELTVPVRFGALDVRGFLDEAGQLVPLAGTELQRIGTVLYLVKADVPGLALGATLTVGALGAVTADGGKAYRLSQPPEPVDDGLILAVALGGGR